ncbi:MAG TPA: hypothetical protein VFI29_19025 [Hanamia sp.]|nr:hypothetical protein [Hanamia sp.]
MPLKQRKTGKRNDPGVPIREDTNRGKCNSVFRFVKTQTGEKIEKVDETYQTIKNVNAIETKEDGEEE